MFPLWPIISNKPSPSKSTISIWTRLAPAEPIAIAVPKEKVVAEEVFGIRNNPVLFDTTISINPSLFMSAAAAPEQVPDPKEFVTVAANEILEEVLVFLKKFTVELEPQVKTSSKLSLLKSAITIVLG